MFGGLVSCFAFGVYCCWFDIVLVVGIGCLVVAVGLVFLLGNVVL